MKHKIIKITDKNYPVLLKQIKNYPEKLYAIGNIDLLNSNCIAIVGSRNCTTYGEKVTKQFVTNLSKQGITIVSGMALGIDTIVHKETIKSEGKTIAVLGSGFDYIYPEENSNLFKEIINSEGLVITEYCPKTEVNMKNYPVRNRIISGISLGVLVTEAKHRSGASLTANIAKEQNRKVFCVPSNLDNKYIRTNELIQQGAKLVIDEKDILSEFTELKQDIKIKSVGAVFVRNTCELDSPCPQPIDILPEYMPVYKLLIKQPMHINQICKALNQGVSEIGSILTMLELEDKIEQLPGKIFKIKG